MDPNATTAAVRGRRPRVFGGSTHPDLLRAVCQHLQVQPGRCKVRTFDNENVHAEFQEDVGGATVFLLQSFGSPVNSSIMELLVMADAARRAGAGRVVAVLPFFAYGRTDSRTGRRVPVTARLLADLLTVSGVDRVLTVDLHSRQIEGFFRIPVDELSSLDLLAGHLDPGGPDRVVVAPHEGSIRWASRLAERLDLPLAVLHRRGAGTAAERLDLIGDVSGRPVVLIENEVASGGSLARAAHRLARAGASAVSAVATHPVLSAGSVGRLRAAPIDDLMVTDTLPVPDGATAGIPTTVVPVAPLLGAAVRRIDLDLPPDRPEAPADGRAHDS